MNVLLLGASGQVGTALKRLPGVSWRCPDRRVVDLLRPETLVAYLRAPTVDAVVHAAAFTDVDAAEGQSEQAHRINAEATGVLARWCADAGVPLVHLSTAYVFDGAAGRPYTPDDTPSPLNVYGHSKLAGEQAILASGCHHAIVRTCAVFSRTHANFVRAILDASRTRPALDVVADQWVGPTSSVHLAQDLMVVLRHLVRDGGRHITHLTGGPDVTYADLARAVVRAAGRPVPIRDIASSAWSGAAQRPQDARLCAAHAWDTFRIPRHDWRPEMLSVVTP